MNTCTYFFLVGLIFVLHSNRAHAERVVLLVHFENNGFYKNIC